MATIEYQFSCVGSNAVAPAFEGIAAAAERAGMARKSIDIGRTGGELIGLVASCEPCAVCGDGGPDTFPTFGLYVDQDTHRTSLQCNPCGAWRVL